MAPLLSLAVVAALAQVPDFIDAKGQGQDHLVLAAGGWVYRWSGGEFQLSEQLGGPAASLTRCAPGVAVAVGRGGLLRLLTLEKRAALDALGQDLWDVASDGCEDVVAVGEGGRILQLSIDAGPPRLQDTGRTRPLYGVSVKRGRATAVGAGGELLHRAAKEAPWRVLQSQTSSALLAVHQLSDGAFVVAGEGGLWRGNEQGLTQMWRDEREAFTRLSFANEEVGIALGQGVVLVTWNGGRTWTPHERAGWLAAAPVGPDAFFLYGRDGRIERLEARQRPKGQAPQKATARPSPAAEPTRAVAPGVDEPLKKVRAVEVADDPQCRSAVPRQGVSGPGFVDVRRVKDGFLLAGSDGTVRRYRLGKMETLARPGVPMLGIAAEDEGRLVTAVGFGRFAHSRDGGKSWKVEPSPGGATFLAVAYAGKSLLAFDDRGRGFRRAMGEQWVELDLPRRATFYTASFADSLRGYVAGGCGTLLETVDGGLTWRALASPAKELQGVLAGKDALHLAAQEGVFLSLDRGESWAKVLDLPGCIRLAAQADQVAVACANLGAPLWISEGGRRFEKVALDQVVHILLSLAFEADGSLVAVGPSEVVVHARGLTGKLAHDSVASREGLARAQWLWNELRRAERERPTSVVRAPSPRPGR